MQSVWCLSHRTCIWHKNYAMFQVCHRTAGYTDATASSIVLVAPAVADGPFSHIVNDLHICAARKQYQTQNSNERQMRNKTTCIQFRQKVHMRHSFGLPTVWGPHEVVYLTYPLLSRVGSTIFRVALQ